MTPRFLFVHGWAMDGTLWDGVRAELGTPADSVRELGYFGASAAASPATGAPVIGVGHSLGLLRLLGEPPTGLVGLAAINGFTRFTLSADHPAGVPARLLHRMLRRLEQDADATATAFRTRCGLAGPLPAPAVPAALRHGLELLRDGDGRDALRHLGVPVLALSGDRDEVVPPALSAACFGAVRWVEEGGHLLPLTHAGRCAQALREFAYRLA